MRKKTKEWDNDKHEEALYKRMLKNLEKEKRARYEEYNGITESDIDEILKEMEVEL